ncbi:hypothetical protein [Stygiolobus caldivivus]|uniref:Uncharacterized protein n=1 Tax=Stygiolobus caldivivus TaxID=2824673 RepID=A0A8D5U4T5_9CREN|nr:hypothetical protein [Stygiolobus caldivivus]BCU69273.1 hypothetical protein KN1_05700 [Stygiolobus caldivivus]
MEKLKFNKQVYEAVNAILLTLLIVFGLSFISNIIPFAGAPYTIITSYFIIHYHAPLLLAGIYILVSGIGAALAKILTYLLGVGLEKPLNKNKNLPILKRFINSKYFLLSLFILAILPGLPLDDYLYIGGGLVKTSLLRMIKITIPAKIIKSSIEIPLEILGIIQISSISGLSPLELTIISSVAFVILGIILVKIDWERIYVIIKQKYPKFSL